VKDEAVDKAKITASIFQGFVDEFKTVTADTILSPSIRTAIHGIYLLAMEKNPYEPAKKYVTELCWHNKRPALFAYIAMLRQDLTDANHYTKTLSHLYLSRNALYLDALASIIQAKMKAKCTDTDKGSPHLSLKNIREYLCNSWPGHSTVPYGKNKKFFEFDILDNQLVDGLIIKYGLARIGKNNTADPIEPQHNAATKAIAVKLEQRVEVVYENCSNTTKIDHIKVDLGSDNFASRSISPNSIRNYLVHTPATPQAEYIR